MATNYETEYNNRARVPEHPEIFARWQRESAAYRDQAAKENRAELGIKYGPSARQFIDLFKSKDGDGAPLAMFVHGGYWRSLEPASFSQMARGMNAHGIAVAVSGYDLCPQVSIGDIVRQTQAACLHLWKRFGERIMVSGHSAGGHLAACMAATDWKALDPAAPADLVPCAYAISGLFDLTPLTHVSMNQELKLDEGEARRVSPLFWRVPARRVLDAVVGGDESSEFLRQSRVIAEAWQVKAETRYEAIPGKNHFTVCDAMTDPQSAMTRRLAELSRRAQSQ